jgi:hypothetical protein
MNSSKSAPKGLVDFGAVGVVAVSASVVAAAVYLALLVLAEPGGFKTAMAGLESRTTQAESALKSGRGRSAFPAGSICSDSSDVAAAALKTRLQILAGAAGVTLAEASATPGALGEDGMTLRVINLQFRANGRYDAMMTLLGALANGRPAIFVDTADLANQTSSVDLKFQGRVFCSSAAHR